MKESRKDARAAGDKWYYTGIPCIRGHNTRRSVASGRCRECDRAKSEERAAMHPEKIKAAQRKYDATTRKKKPAAYHEARRVQKNEYYDKNRDRFNRIKRENYENDKDIVLNSNKRWRKRNRDAIRVLNACYRGRKRGARGVIKIEFVRKLLELQGSACKNCSADISVSYHIDHIIPLSRGGSNMEENIQLLCPTCNLRKGSLTQEEFKERQQADKSGAQENDVKTS